MLEYEGCSATNHGHVRVAQLDKLHKLADKPLHVGSWMIARLAAHTPSPPATASAEGAQLNGRPFPATASAEGAQLNVPPSLACGPVLCPCMVRLYGIEAESVKRFPRLSALDVYQDCYVPVYNDNLTTGRCCMFFL